MTCPGFYNKNPLPETSRGHNLFTKKNTKHIIPTIVFTVLSLILAFCPLPFSIESRISQSDSEIITANVIETDNSDVGKYGIIRQGEQHLKIIINEGRMKGQTIEATNLIKGDIEFDNFNKPGDEILVTLNYDGNGKFRWASPAGNYRLGAAMWLGLVFLLALILVCGWIGVKAAVSFIFSSLMIWKVLVPLFLSGCSPIPAAFIVIVPLAGCIMFLVGGFSRKGVVALLGCMGGLFITALCSVFFSGSFHINGAVRPFAKTLLMRFPELPITEIFLAGIFISASGAVMDLAMDIASAMEEIHLKKPTISRIELFRSGLSIGRYVVGTMTTTLLFAYSGGYIMAMMWFMLQGVDARIFFNTTFMGAEILNTLAGSFGLITVAPLSALAGALIYCLPKKIIHEAQSFEA